MDVRSGLYEKRTGARKHYFKMWRMMRARGMLETNVLYEVSSFEKGSVLVMNMDIKLRKAVETNWPGILDAANTAVPWTPRENQEWLGNRMRFDQTGYPRRHYVAEDTTTGKVIGYGAVEGGREQSYFRIFIVMAPDLLTAGVGDLIYNQLVADLTILHATVIWAREYARDHALLSFLTAHGFTETSRITTDGGLEAVVMERSME